MSMESSVGGLKEEPEEMAITGLAPDGTPEYGRTESIAGKGGGIPEEAFEIAADDLYSVKNNNQALRFYPKEILMIGINSTKKVQYQILDRRNGHYLIVKVDNRGHRDPVSGATKFTVVRSNQSVDIQNPDMVVCSADQVDNWLRQ